MKNLFKVTSGGAGDSTLFKGWSDKKLKRYNIDPDTYSNTTIATCPAIMMEGYCTQRVPCLTIIFLQDKIVGVLLSSRHNPISIGVGEPGMGTAAIDNTATIDNVDNVSTITSDIWISPMRRAAPKNQVIATVGGLETSMMNAIKL